MNIIIRKDLKDCEDAVKQRVEMCLSDGNKKVYIYGCGMMGRFVYKQLKDKLNIAGFIDRDKNKQNEQMSDNKSVYDLKAVDCNSCIIIASLVGWSAIYRRCKSQGYINCFHYEELAFYDHTLPHWDRAFEGMAGSILNQWEKYMQIYDMLSDDKSKEIFENVITFRLTMDVKYMETAYALSTQNGEKTYFDPDIIKTDENEVFVDCGGYCGETTKEFVQFVLGKYHKIYLFEPDVNLVQKIERELLDIRDVVIFPYGVGKEEEILLFNAVGDLSGNFSEDGTEPVKVVRIGDVIKEKVSFIKMDIEGMELDALQGASEVIKRDKPKMAISVYHKCDDIFAIAEQVLNYREDYRLYMRHYSPNCDDTVMFFV